MIAIFDIGKTNKKLFVFDEDYNIVHEISAHLDETKDEDGDPCEDIELLTSWIKNTFNEVSSKFNIDAVNFSTYGASFVHLGNNLLPVAPLYNYLKPFPEDLKEQFYNDYGGLETFAKTTASPVLGNLNSGMILYLLKHRKPGVFEVINRSLHLPQYVSSIFTSSACSDLTSIGCHTNLWDFTAHRYHPWVKAEGIDSKLAPIRLSNATFEIGIVHKILYSGIGLHDSSAALIPYLMHSSEPFVLLSTGTWCISLNPFNEEPLTTAELGQDCLCYLTYEGKPVKASRLFLGHIHEEKCRELTTHFAVAEDAYKHVEPDAENTPFEKAYNELMKDLVKQQVKATNLILQKNTKTIYVDGGFSQNKIFMKLLAKAYPDKEVYASTVTQASALGAALAIHDKWNSKPIKKNLLSLTCYS
jgi:sugar (pentulose or hexulose) kinase